MPDHGDQRDYVTAQVRYVQNEVTGTVHRVLIAPGSDQRFSGEGCNLDQLAAKEQTAHDEAPASAGIPANRCGHCWG